jgi:hypothetical protein
MNGWFTWYVNEYSNKDMFLCHQIFPACICNYTCTLDQYATLISLSLVVFEFCNKKYDETLRCGIKEYKFININVTEFRKLSN